jgi:hypothetical protein
LHRPYYLQGPRGVGKTTCARILAKMINHDGTQKPDEDFAFNIFELDAASNNSVDDIRSLIDQVRIPPQVGNYTRYILLMRYTCSLPQPSMLFLKPWRNLPNMRYLFSQPQRNIRSSLPFFPAARSLILKGSP